MSDEEMNDLVTALEAHFTDTELHALIITASAPAAQQYSHWQKLRQAAVAAAGCLNCAIEQHTRR